VCVATSGSRLSVLAAGASLEGLISAVKTSLWAGLLSIAALDLSLAAMATPPTAACTGQCQTCIELEGGTNRCLKCGIDPVCLGGDGGLSPDFTAMLNSHNAYRARHGVPALTWSAQLARGSQTWANSCTPERNNSNRFAHSPEAWSSPSGYGENLFWGQRTAATDAVDWWYKEIQHYDFNNPLESFTAGDTNSAKEVRHFTQVVWRGSQQLGCAVAVCRGMNYWVCRYSPPGNFNAMNPGVLEANVPRSLGSQPQASGTRPQSSPLEPVPAQAGGGSWSAFATNERGYWGYAVHQPNEDQARRLAANGCGGSARGCTIFWTTTNTCVAYAESRTGGYWYAAGGGNTAQEATANALRYCQSGTAPANSCVNPGVWCR
jgi:uncharacterized protein YkwD